MPFLSRTCEPASPSYAESEALEKRKQEAENVLDKFQGGKIPVLVEREKNANMQTIDQKKYLVPKDLEWQKFIGVIRRRMKLEPHKAIFLYVNNVQPPVTSTMEQLYQEHKAESGFLECVYSNENTFGDLAF